MRRTRLLVGVVVLALAWDAADPGVVILDEAVDLGVYVELPAVGQVDTLGMRRR